MKSLRERPPPDARGASIAFAVLGAAAAALLVASLVGAAGLPPGLLRAGAALLAARASWRLVARRLGAAAGVAVRGAGWAGASYVALASFTPPYDAFALGVAAFLLGAFAFAAPRDGARHAWIWFAAALALIAVAFRSLPPVPPYFADAPAWRFTAVFAATVAALVGTRVGRRLRRGRDEWWDPLLESEIRNAALVLPFSAYVLYRDALAVSLRHFEVYEWSLGVALAGYLVALVRGRFRDLAQGEPWSLEGGRHEQTVAPRPDPAFAEAVRIFEAFVDRGEERESYAAFWRDVLSRAGFAAEDAERLVSRALDAPGAAPARRGVLSALSALVKDRDVGREKRAEAHRAILARVVEAVEWKRHAGTHEGSSHLQSHPR